MVRIEPQEPKTRVVRNDRSYYQENEKPDFNKVLDDAIRGYFRKEVRPYAPCGAKKPDGTPDKTCTETIYYDADGNELASVFNVRASKYETTESGNFNAIHTPEADYQDWDMDGRIDSKAVDKEVPVENPQVNNPWWNIPTNFPVNIPRPSIGN